LGKVSDENALHFILLQSGIVKDLFYNDRGDRHKNIVY